MTAAAPDRVEHVTGLYVGIFTASIAVGAFAGTVLLVLAAVTRRALAFHAEEAAP